MARALPELRGRVTVSAAEKGHAWHAVSEELLNLLKDNLNNFQVRESAGSTA